MILPKDFSPHVCFKIIEIVVIQSSLSLRQSRLANSFNNIILETLSQLFQPLLTIIKSEEFRKIVNEMGGYDTAQTGDTIFIS
jgi:hypothetical protein